MATYPAAVAALPTTVTDNTDSDNADETLDHANNHNNVNAEVIAIETELGVNPRGAFGTVALRLAANDTTVSGKASTASVSAKADLVSGRVPQTQLPTNRVVIAHQSGSTYPERTEAAVPQGWLGALEPVGTGVSEVAGDFWIPS